MASGIYLTAYNNFVGIKIGEMIMVQITEWFEKRM
jgi:hypothetical protein